MSEYDLNRGINKSWEFKGLVGSNVYYLVAGIGVTFVAFIAMFMMGVPFGITALLTLAFGGLMWTVVFRINAKYGEHGLMKASARRSAPKYITNRKSRLFINLNEDRTGR